MWMLFIALTLSFLHRTIIGQTISRSTPFDSSSVDCDDTGNQCTVECTAEQSCSGEIHCPSGSSCTTCNIECTSDSSCKNSIIYSYNCSSVSVTVDGDYSLESSTVYAPGDNGQLIIVADSTDYGFHQSTVYADKETNKIKIECYDREQVNDGSGNYAPRAVCECCGNTIYATDSSYFEWQCQSTTDCGVNEIYCPANFAGNSINSCLISHTQNNVTGNKYYAINGIGIV